MTLQYPNLTHYMWTCSTIKTFWCLDLHIDIDSTFVAILSLNLINRYIHRALNVPNMPPILFVIILGYAIYARGLEDDLDISHDVSKIIHGIRSDIDRLQNVISLQNSRIKQLEDISMEQKDEIDLVFENRFQDVAKVKSLQESIKELEEKCSSTLQPIIGNHSLSEHTRQGTCSYIVKYWNYFFHMRVIHFSFAASQQRTLTPPNTWSCPIRYMDFF